MLARFGLLPEQASTVAARVDALYFFLIAVSLFFSLLIAGLLLSFAVQYRRRSEAETPTQIHGSLVLELTWSIIPFALSMVMFFWGASIFVTLKRPPNDALQLYVVGKQWMWKVQHLEGRREINEVHVPVGRPVKLTMTSEDVIHSFYVPAFRIKQDAIPGRYTTAWFEATKPGRYHLFCAEYCGTDHSGMIGWITVMEPADYQTWLAETGGIATTGSAPGETPPSLVSAGEALFGQLGCATCHRGAAGTLGPSLVGQYGKTVRFQSGETATVDDAYLRESILRPQAKIVAGYQGVMPTFQGLVSEEGLMQLIAYIKSLQAPAGASDAPSGGTTTSGATGASAGAASNQGA